MARGQFAVAKHSTGWIVVNRSGARVAGVFSSHAQAETRREAMEAAARRRRRPCMCCGHVFLSEGPHNRLCTGCRGRGSVLPDPAGLPPQRGA